MAEFVVDEPEEHGLDGFVADALDGKDGVHCIVGLDPRRDPIEAKTVRQWKKGDLVVRYVTYHVGTFKGAKARMAAFYAFRAGKKNLPGLLSDFPHKTAVTKAGLGWVGKNALFVSEEFGCGMRLATALTDARFVPGKPVTESRCGDCVECVKACPYGAIRATNWHPGIEREKLLDAFLCSEKREAFISKLGYKHPCGLCIKACPVGKRI